MITNDDMLLAARLLRATGGSIAMELAGRIEREINGEAHREAVEEMDDEDFRYGEENNCTLCGFKINECKCIEFGWR